MFQEFATVTLISLLVIMGSGLAVAHSQKSLKQPAYQSMDECLHKMEAMAEQSPSLDIEKICLKLIPETTLRYQ